MVEENPLISVIVPCYNVEKYVKKAISSIINQTYENLEIIIIDDGSEDNTLNILKGFKQTDSRIRLIIQENLGQSAARNRGLDIAKGEYIAFVDSDDFIQPDMIYVLYSLIKKFNVEVSSCLHKIYTKEKDSKKYFPLMFEQKHTKKMYDNDNIMLEFLKGKEFSRGPVTKLYKATLLDNIRFEEGRLHEDNYFNYQIFKIAQSSASIDYQGYFYVNNYNSSTKSKFSIEQYDKIVEEEKIYAEVSKFYPQYIEEEIKNLIACHWWVCKKILVDSTFSEFFSGKTKEFIKRFRYYYMKDKKYFKNSSSIFKPILSLVDKCPIIFLVIIFKFANKFGALN